MMVLWEHGGMTEGEPLRLRDLLKRALAGMDVSPEGDA